MNNKIIIDLMRRSYLDIIYKRIDRGKSSLITGEFGSGKSKFLEQIQPKKFTILKVESLGSLNHILISILRQRKYRFKPKMNKSVDYLEAICTIKGNVIIIDDVNDLRPFIFRHIKRIIDSKIPVVMAGTSEVQTVLMERHEDVFSRLRVLKLEPVSVENLREKFPMFEPQTLEVVFGFAFGNMWIFNEICEACIDKMLELKQNKVTMDIVNTIIEQYQE